MIFSVLEAFLVPPGNLLLWLLLAMLLTWRRPRVARGVCVLGLSVIYSLSIPAVGAALLQWLEPSPSDPRADLTGQAIVVLGGGPYRAAPEYGGDTVNAITLVRLRYGASLQRALGKPLLVSGGHHRGGSLSEAHAMRSVLQNEFQVPVAWTEPRSSNTLANARESYAVLKAAGISRIYLVTHAFHMPRARYAFESAGFSVIPASTAYTRRAPATALDFLPDAQAFFKSAWFFHEVIGIFWYHLRVAAGR